MFIGHLPGAYLVFRAATPGIGKLVFAAALFGAVAPDLDMLWFYFVDDRAHHHHAYLTHRPILWAGIVLAGFLLGLRWSHAGRVLSFFGAGGLVHMGLDSIVGEIAWAWPLSEFSHPLVTVEATHSNWILSFLTHWTFTVEIGVTVLAVIVWFRRQKTANHKSQT
ncbi:metal-dependent hydrolase [Ruegeria lacuscaerulensis]|uniref:metal-dependent hydrolase n=1 Tax=Ruegeria lacuscaerulensis TaxID=55218 RepID=UPI00147E5AAB|nr:metal-dependent hydrolase [Ruegeria lacuscaerulensis]